MDEKARIIDFWEKEGRTTRKVISRIPEGSDYRPDPKSRTAREIAWLIVHEEMTLMKGLEDGRLDWVDVPAPATMREALEIYDRHQESFVNRLRVLETARWDRQVPFYFGDVQAMTDTGFAMAWGFLFDIVHHRGQLTAYLRAMGSTVPQIYGPSADEPM